MKILNDFFKTEPEIENNSHHFEKNSRNLSMQTEVNNPESLKLESQNQTMLIASDWSELETKTIQKDLNTRSPC